MPKVDQISEPLGWTCFQHQNHVARRALLEAVASLWEMSSSKCVKFISSKRSRQHVQHPFMVWRVVACNAVLLKPPSSTSNRFPLHWTSQVPGEKHRTISHFHPLHCLKEVYKCICHAPWWNWCSKIFCHHGWGAKRTEGPSLFLRLRTGTQQRKHRFMHGTYIPPPFRMEKQKWQMSS